MKYVIWPLFGVVLFFTNSFSQKPDDFIILSYNVENLFDTINTPDKYDEAFTPTGKKNWNSNKYSKKITAISKVISSVNEELPDVIGLIEIENKTVLTDLVKSASIQKANYKIIHKESPDARGIDVAILYKPDRFEYIEHDIIRIKFPFNAKLKTRDILHVKGIALPQDTIHLYLNHWPSRRGGQEKSEIKRIYVARQLKKHIDSVLSVNNKAKIIAIGDFNDNPVDKSLFETLNANNIRTNINPSYLFNLLFDEYNTNGFGSYLYRGNYNMLDNIVVSQELIHGNKGYIADYNSAHIYTPVWLCNKNSKIKKPFKTFKGLKYLGGYSDHFPVYIVLKSK